MSEPMAELQFTEEEIDHGVKALNDAASSHEGLAYELSDKAEAVRAVLRAVRAVPARCLNGTLAGQPAAVGTNVQGTGVGGVVVRGTVETSYPVTTTVQQPNGERGYLWTNTIRSWDPSTEPLRERVEVSGPTVDPRVAGMHPIGVNPATGRIVFVPDEQLVADDDGMAVEVDR